MAEYVYKDMTNEIGWGATFSSTGRAPVIGNRIFPTLSDLNNYVTSQNSTAIAGVILGVVADPVDANNGVYQVTFVDTTLIDPTDNTILFWDETNDRSNLQVTKLGTGSVVNDRGVQSGAVVEGFFATISGEEYFVTKTGENTYTYVDDQGQTQTYTYQGETVHTYILLNLVDGDKVYINADSLAGGGGAPTNIDFNSISGADANNDTYSRTEIVYNATSGQYDVDSSLKIVNINSVTGAANDGLATALDVKNFDCGSFTI